LRSLCGSSGRRMGRELLCNAGRKVSDHYVVIVERELEGKYCVPRGELLVIIMW
jgi:hypothetical protein